MTDLQYQDMLPLGKDETPYRLVTTDHVSTFEAAERPSSKVEPEALRVLTREAMRDIAHLLRPGHLAQLRAILDDPEASPTTASSPWTSSQRRIAAGGVLPSCQDTGTAIVMGKKGQYVFTGGGDEAAIARGRVRHLPHRNLRYSQLAPARHVPEVNTGTTCRRRSSSTRPTATPTSSSSWRRAAAAPTRATCFRRPRPCSTRRACSPSSRAKLRSSAPPRARRTTSPSSSAAPPRSTRSRWPSSRRPGTSTPPA
jgi:hypothetical protein